MLRLVGTHGAQRFVIPLGPSPLVFGASSKCHIRIDLPGISREHARVERTEDGVSVTDLESKNGLWWEGEKRSRIAIRPRDSFQIGVLTLTLEEISTGDHEISPWGAIGAPITRTHIEPGFEAAKALPNVLGALRDLAGRPAACGALELFRLALGFEMVAIFRRGPAGEWAIEDTAGAADFELWPDSPAAAGRVQATGRTTAVVVHAPILGPSRELAEEAAATLLAVAEGSAANGSAPRRARQSWVSDLVLPAGFLPGSSPAARALLEEVAAAVHSGLNVLLRGESGVGKEFLAQMIHASGATPEGRFVALDCPSIPGGLVESELFGIAAHVATGVKEQMGRLREADGGTLFLDEVGDLPLDQQAKLLRSLQERVVVSVGGRSQGHAVNLRVVSATSRDLTQAVSEGRFRADLYYRLAGFVVRIPPLRERREDLPQLAAHYAQKAASAQRKALAGISRKALERLLELDWPGNVRQLQGVVTRAISYAESGDALRSDHLERALRDADGSALPPPPTSPADPHRSMAEQVEACQRSAALAALAAERGNRTRAAERLGMTRNGLLALLKRLGLDKGGAKPSW